MGEAPEHGRRCHTPVTATNDPVRRLDVPRIVAFGRRNAGKSRALEAIASINFPVSFSSSAHYVTELTMSPGPAFRVTASVRLADPDARVRELCTGHCLADVQRCLDEARAAFPRTDPEGDLSDSVLEICITGPGLFPLRLVDVPGASFTERKEQVEVQRGWSTAVTTAKVTNIIRGYVKPQNTVILAVVAAEDAARACSNTVTVAAQYDPEKRRTLGIVTGADSAANSARSEAYQKLENKLHWGWHLLGGSASTGASVDEAQDPDADDSGIPGPNSGALASLHEALCDLLFHQMQAQIPAVKGSVQASLAERLQSREALGPERPALRDQWFFLVQSAFAFQKLCRDAQQPEYPDDGAAAFFRTGGDAAQLGTRLRCLARAFSQIVHDYGAVGNTVQGYASYPSVPPPSKRLSELLLALQRRPRPTLQHIPLDELRISAKAMAAERGQSPAASARALFRRLAANWKALAWQYVQHALCECRAFVELVFEHLVPAYGHTRDLLVARFVEPFFEECEEALAAKVDELAEPYEKGYCSLSEPTVSEDIPIKKVRGKSYYPVPPSILETVESYYDESQATFTDNVVNLAVERCLVRRIGTLFTPEIVRCMSDEEVAEIASESLHTQAQRKLLEQQIETLTSELDYWRRFRPTKAHFNLVLPSEFQASSALADTMEPAPVK
ncbi:Dynamin family [Cordyceps militaris]|uniref:Dynamin family n=1 Tax=Cordyceps militaris TaxID=73501 RepID=A0A2H4SIE4_CORMI|nr:Dynamin family [Cordyceps militaris]